MPSNLTELCSLLGLVNQLADFTTEVTEAVDTLRELLSPKRDFVWTPVHQASFEAIQKVLSMTPALALFDTALPTMTAFAQLVSIDFPSKQLDVLHELPDFWKICDELSTEGRLVLHCSKLIIPALH